MHGTLPQKIARTITSLALHPQYIPRCVTHNLINGTTPLELELPWFSYAAIDFLEDYVNSNMFVCEYGSGGSTLFFAKRARSVFSIENDTHRFDLVSHRLKAQSRDNVTMRLHPFDFKNPVGFDDSAYLHAIPNGRFDVIVVDGCEEGVSVRPACFKKAQARIKPGGIVVVDDSWCYPELREHNRANEVRTFKSVGPCRPGVTTTDVFFY